MKAHALFTASALLLAGGLLAAPTPAHAGDLTNAQLGCYVDTNAFDVPTAGSCASAWTPGNPTSTVAVFEVLGLPSGSYTFNWIDLETGQQWVCWSGAAGCYRDIDLWGNNTAAMAVVIYDNQTGASKTVSADAYFFDGWH